MNFGGDWSSKSGVLSDLCGRELWELGWLWRFEEMKKKKKKWLGCYK